MRKFLRRKFIRGWTIGWDIRNGALLQFVKTIPYRKTHRIINLWFFSYREASRTVENKETRIWVNIGWSQSWGWLWLG